MFLLFVLGRAANGADCIHDLYCYRGLLVVDRIKRVRKKKTNHTPAVLAVSVLTTSYCQALRPLVGTSLLAAGGSLKCLFFRGLSVPVYTLVWTPGTGWKAAPVTYIA